MNYSVRKKTLFDYDPSSRDSILYYAKKLEGRTFREVLNDFNKYYVRVPSPQKGKTEIKAIENLTADEMKASTAAYEFNGHSKGKLGSLLEVCYFGYELNSNQEADFAEAGVELKTTCLDRKKGRLQAGERLSITNLSFDSPVEEDFYKSHVWEKISRILLIQYERDRDIDALDQKIQFVNLVQLPEEDLEMIKSDYHQIIDKVKAGLAHEISEGDTMYLGACTKGAKSATNYRNQYYGSHVLAQKRNFCLKLPYMKAFTAQYVLTGKIPGFRIPNSGFTDFERFITNRVKGYVGMTSEEIGQRVQLDMDPRTKHFLHTSVLYMLGVKSNKVEEFEKAGVVVKTIHMDSTGYAKEKISLPATTFEDIAEKSWENSNLREYLSSTKFFFTVYRDNEEGDPVFQGSWFWNMPVSDLEGEVQRIWRKAKAVLMSPEGVELQPVVQKSGRIAVKNNLPGMAESRITHIRPHTSHSYHRLADGTVYATKGTPANAFVLPDGYRMMTKQCFWLDTSYILRELGLNH
ncbi:Sau3AI family type II restriction endonuclease [Faecalibaculum rodentium]|uniref:Sau3AI family type II restriction endonuclease n=1 Tax=Faecalibaculum rodentium TaxID=1702221 RepID=UPI0025A52BD4|nr:Sau3AI family type II restriction endonuclease [Faecalibaculum rodentium]